MPKKPPGVTLQFVVSTDDGRAESGYVRSMPNVLHFKAMRSIEKAVRRLHGKDENQEELALPGNTVTTTSV